MFEEDDEEKNKRIKLVDVINSNSKANTKSLSSIINGSNYSQDDIDRTLELSKQIYSTMMKNKSKNNINNSNSTTEIIYNPVENQATNKSVFEEDNKEKSEINNDSSNKDISIEIPQNLTKEEIESLPSPQEFKKLISQTPVKAENKKDNYLKGQNISDVIASIPEESDVLLPDELKMQKQLEEKNNNNIFMKIGTWIKDLVVSIPIEAVSKVNGIVKSGIEGHSERTEMLDKMSDDEVIKNFYGPLDSSKVQAKELPDSLINAMKGYLYVEDTGADFIRSTGNGIKDLLNVVVDFMEAPAKKSAFSILNSMGANLDPNMDIIPNIPDIPDFSGLKDSEKYGEYNSQEDLTKAILEDKNNMYLRTGTYNPSANMTASLALDVITFLALKKVGLSSTSASVLSSIVNTYGETGSVRETTKDATVAYAFSKILESKSIKKIGESTFNKTENLVKSISSKYPQWFDTNIKKAIADTMPQAVSSFTKTGTSRLVAGEVGAVLQEKDIFNGETQKNIVIDSLLWAGVSSLEAGYSGVKYRLNAYKMSAEATNNQLDKWYKTLGLDRNSTPSKEEIRKARNALVKQYHTDVTGNYSDQTIYDINEAYEGIMKFLETNELYDIKIEYENVKEKPQNTQKSNTNNNAVMLLEDGSVYIDGNTIAESIIRNEAVSQSEVAIVPQINEEGEVESFSQSVVVPFEVENSQLPNIRPGITVNDDNESLTVIDMNTGTKLLTGVKNTEEAITKVTDILSNGDEATIKNIKMALAENAYASGQAIEKIISVAQNRVNELVSETQNSTNEGIQENNVNTTDFIQNNENNTLQSAKNDTRTNLNNQTSNYTPQNENDVTKQDITSQNISTEENEQKINSYIQEMAINFQDDLANTTSGKRYKVGDTWTGQKRSTTKELANIKDSTGASWQQISNVLNDIAEGKENNSKLARTIKAEIDEALSNGYKNIYGQIIMPSEDYLREKGQRDGVDYFKQDTTSEEDIFDGDDRIFGMKKSDVKSEKVNLNDEIQNIKENLKESNIQLNKDYYKKYNSITDILNNELLKKRKAANITSNKNIEELNLNKMSTNEIKKEAKKQYNNQKSKLYIDGFEIKVSNRDIDEIINSANYNEHQEKYMKEQLILLSQLEKIIDNAILVTQNPEGKSRKNNILWNYYIADFKLNDNIFTVIFDIVSRDNGENHLRIQYISPKNNIADTSTKVANNSTISAPKVSATDTSISQNNTKVKSSTSTKSMQNNKNNTKIKVQKTKYSDELKSGEYIDLNNKTVESADDLADLAQVFRNPNYETFRVVYTKENTIVGQEALTTRTSNEVRISDKTKNKTKYYYKINNRMERLDADGYYLIHNHPSGKAKASQADINLTYDFDKNIKGFQGHIIINSGTYAILSKDNNGLIFQEQKKLENYKPDEIDKMMSEEPWTKIKINSKEQLVSLMHNVKNNPEYSTLVLVDAILSPRAIIDIPNSFMNMTEEQIDGYIKNMSPKYGATKAFIATQNKEAFEKIKKLKTIQDGLLYSNNSGELFIEEKLEPKDQVEIKNFIKQEQNNVRSMKKSNAANVERDNTSPTSNEDIRYLKKDNKTNRNNNNNNIKTNLSTENINRDDTDTITLDSEVTNAERADAWIEQEIKKIEKSGEWDDTIPVTKMTDIRKMIEDYLGINIKRGHFRQRALAIYKTKRDVIRTKELSDMDSILHETGHALDIGKRIEIDKESIADELLTAISKYDGYKNETRKVKLEEGFAEIIREYAIIPDQAKADYPQTIAILEGIKQNDKEFNTFMTNLQKQIYNYIHQNPYNRQLSRQSIGEHTDKKPWTKERIKQAIMIAIWDRDYAIKEAVEKQAKASGKSMKDIEASKNAYYLVRLTNGIGDKITSFLADGYIDENGKKITPGLNQIGEILGDDPKRYNDLRVYLVARRDVEYKAEKLKTGLRNMDTKAVLEQFKDDIQIQKAAQVIYDTLDGVLQYAVDNHLITEEEAKSLRESNVFYVPMQRVLENRGNQVGRRGAVSDIIKARTGSDLDIKDVLENVIVNCANIIRQVENNKILNALYEEGESSGLKGTVYDVIDTPMKKIGTANLWIWEEELKRQGVDTSNLDLDKTINIFSPNNAINVPEQITSFIDSFGERRYLQFYDKITFYSITGIDIKTMSWILRISSYLNMPLRHGATMANLTFAIPNMISDTAQATIYSTAGFVPVIDNALGVLGVLASTNKTVRNFVNQVSPEYAKRINYIYTLYNQTGATNSTRLSQYRETTQNIMKDVYGTKNSEILGIHEKFKPLKRLLDLMTYIPELSEQSTRFRVFERNYNYYKNKGNSETDARIMAALEARDATQDFSRSGILGREINQFIAFSAARVGSAYTFAEKVKANPKQVGMRIAILTAIAMAIKAMGYDDDEIEELNQRKKDDNFVLKVGDNIITIKKPQGILRSIINLAEYIQDLATGHIEEGKEGEKLGEWLNNAIMDNMPADEVTGLVPNAIAPLIENAINKDFYYNTDIVKSYDLDLPNSEQYYDYNSQLAILLGKVFNYSPAKIDNLISGYFGGLGTQTTNAIDSVLGTLGIIPEKPAMGAEDNAIGKRFVVNVNENSASVDEIYNLKTELTKKKNGGTITKEEEEKLERITDAASSMAIINKQIKSIKKSLTLSGEEKAEQIKELQKQKTDTARQALGKDLLYSENENKIESTKFYPSSNTLKQSGYTLNLTDSMKKEYEKLAYEKYASYAKQGIYSEEKLEDIASKCKEYAKKEMMKKYRNDLVKSK